VGSVYFFSTVGSLLSDREFAIFPSTAPSMPQSVWMHAATPWLLIGLALGSLYLVKPGENASAALFSSLRTAPAIHPTTPSVFRVFPRPHRSITPTPHRPLAGQSRLVPRLSTVAPLDSVPEIVPRSDARAADFQFWAEKVGIATPKLGLATFSGLDGVTATDDVRDGELIVSIPRSMLITAPEEPDPCPFPEINAGYWRKAHYTTRLALSLLAERRRGDRSPFAPYIAVLPTSFVTPLFWKQEELQALEYPPIQEAIEAQRKEWRSRYDALVASSPAVETTYEEFLWAMSTVLSRSYRGEFPSLLGGERGIRHCLLPWVDMINSRSRTPTRITFNLVFQQLELRAGEAFGKGTQVWLTYDKRNDDLLLNYGYVEVDNPGDSYCIDVDVEALARNATVPLAVAAQRLQTIGNVRLAGFLERACVTRDAPYLKTVQALRMLFAPADKDPLRVKDEVVPATERAVYTTLAALARREVEGWPTTLEADERSLTTARSEPERLALEYRCEKKRVLTAFLAAISRLL
jgi:hypothetical protein